MTYKQFRLMQRTMDEIGLITYIRRSGMNKNRRYEVIVNGEVLKKYKSRRSAKKLIVARFREKLTTV